MENSRIRLFLAEDHHVMRAALRTLLSREDDIEVVGEVADGSRLLEEVERLQPDLVVMDAEMPVHQPAVAVKRLRERCPNVKTLILSAHNKRNYVVELFKAGVAGYVLKDDAADALLKAIRKVVAGEEWISPRVTALLIESLRHKEESSVTELTDRELEVLSLLALGKTNQAIADELFLSSHTVRTHLYHIFEKLGVETRVEAAVFAISQGLVPLDYVKEHVAQRSPENGTPH
jgi:DNA-binding NarL/FixJ family response regulator